MANFTVTLHCETRHALAVDLLRQALKDVAQRFKFFQRLRVSLEKTATSQGALEIWGFKVLDVEIMNDMPKEATDERR